MSTHGRTSSLLANIPGLSGTTTSHSNFLGCSVAAAAAAEVEDILLLS